MDAFENRVEEIALDVGIAVDNLTRGTDVDLLYLTSVGFLVVLTVAIVSALMTYKQSKYHLFIAFLRCNIFARF